MKESLRKTYLRRPDLLEKHELSKEEAKHEVKEEEDADERTSKCRRN